jgi:hypothetical protein
MIEMKRNNTIYINNAYDSVCIMNAIITFSYSFNFFYYNYNYIIIKKNEIHGEFIIPRCITLLIIIV